MAEAIRSGSPEVAASVLSASIPAALASSLISARIVVLPDPRWPRISLVYPLSRGPEASDRIALPRSS